MPEAREQIMDQAIGWTIRLRHAEAGHWQDFVQWLEADAAHRAAYLEVASLDLRVAELFEQNRSPDAAPARQRAPVVGRRALLAVGASAAAAAVAYFMLPGPSTLYAVETEPGERRAINLARGTRIDLNGASRILLDREDARFARLERGEALFTVFHEPSNPFQVEAGDAVIRNVGTVFNVLSDRETLVVEVSEGAVLFTADGEAVGLRAGETIRKEGNRIIAGRREPATIGGWRQGRLSYSSASYSEVARDLSRNSGLAVRAAPEVAGRRFSGVILLDGDREQLRRRISALLDVDVRLAGEGWILAPPDR